MKKKPPETAEDVWRAAGELRQANRLLEADAAIRDHVARYATNTIRRVIEAANLIRTCPKCGGCDCHTALLALLPQPETEGDE